MREHYSDRLEDAAPNLSVDVTSRHHMQERLHRLRTDPEYRARQRIRAQIGQHNSLRDKKPVSLPKFSWDK